MILQHPKSTLTDTLFPFTPLFRTAVQLGEERAGKAGHHGREGEGGELHRKGGDAEGGEALRVHARALERGAEARPDQAVREEQRQQQQGIAGQEEAQRVRSEEHTSELQSLMRISYAVFCLKKK